MHSNKKYYPPRTPPPQKKNKKTGKGLTLYCLACHILEFSQNFDFNFSRDHKFFFYGRRDYESVDERNPSKNYEKKKLYGKGLKIISSGASGPRI